MLTLCQCSVTRTCALDFVDGFCSDVKGLVNRGFGCPNTREPRDRWCHTLSHGVLVSDTLTSTRSRTLPNHGPNAQSKRIFEGGMQKFQLEALRLMCMSSMKFNFDVWLRICPLEVEVFRRSKDMHFAVANSPPPRKSHRSDREELQRHSPPL